MDGLRYLYSPTTPPAVDAIATGSCPTMLLVMPDSGDPMKTSSGFAITRRGRPGDVAASSGGWVQEGVVWAHARQMHTHDAGGDASGRCGLVPACNGSREGGGSGREKVTRERTAGGGDFARREVAQVDCRPGKRMPASTQVVDAG